jgi:A/G-specific adenine glycosylase
MMNIRQFQDEVWRYYDAHGRHDLPWRLPDADGSFDPYKVMVSELMLQQTQVPRVIPKYRQFLELFPTVQVLAAASLGEVLVAWQGLGYNRRAKFLWQAAQMVVNELGGQFPRGQKELTQLPGVGMNTAGAIMAYAYDQPVTFIETNIRTVYIHHFFDDQEGVADKDIEELVRQSLEGMQDSGGRNWYWALMDYGTHIKQVHGNKSRVSKSYIKQSPFHGSRRKVRGAVIRYLSQRPGTLEEMTDAENDPRLPEVLADLVQEGMVRDDAGRYTLA